MPARFLNDHDITTLRQSGIDMNSIPATFGNNIEGIKEENKDKETKFTFQNLQKHILIFLENIYNTLVVLLNNNFNFNELSNNNLINLIIFTLIILMFQLIIFKT